MWRRVLPARQPIEVGAVLEGRHAKNAGALAPARSTRYMGELIGLSLRGAHKKVGPLENRVKHPICRNPHRSRFCGKPELL